MSGNVSETFQCTFLYWKVCEPALFQIEYPPNLSRVSTFTSVLASNKMWLEFEPREIKPWVKQTSKNSVAPLAKVMAVISLGLDGKML